MASESKDAHLGEICMFSLPFAHATSHDVLGIRSHKSADMSSFAKHRDSKRMTLVAKKPNIHAKETH